ncbi:FAD-dependent oxidoreductase [Massilia sp. H6]|uniref:FAD-dependent oxidoreductase n=1 Tax=Massilia sp. H6 TaxID=2970464 RepID=UPI002169A93A|nr:FAD-dependent oxidoreductase [Massilia sp. H6]UVW27365.1 FAD-dependent oxidoreductase [Massilia sp. H6]
MTHADFVLVGGGPASATAAETLRLEGARGSIVIVAAEDALPYHRPPLTSRLLCTDEAPRPVLSQDFYAEHDVTVLRGTRALGLDLRDQVLATDRAGPLRYGQLLLATGARPLRLAVPGADLAGIHYLRTQDDAAAIRRAAASARRAVIVGGGFIGLEVAAALVARGVKVTLLTQGQVLFSQVKDAAVCALFERMLAERGVELLLHTQVAAVREAEAGSKRAQEVVSTDGRSFACDLVVVGIGVEPDTAFLQASGIALGDGIVVDRYLRTSDEHVYAAGDVACYYDPVFNMQRRVEHWDNAVKQGRLAARNMLGMRVPYDEVSYFAAAVFDYSFQFIGVGDDTPEHLRLGDLAAHSAAILYLKNDRARALFTAGRPARETRAVESLIRYRTHLGHVKQRLAQPGFLLSEVPNQTALILQGGGALGAFECGVVRALEEQGVHADVVAGVSIGAFNGAIIASHPRHAFDALAGFWDELSLLTPDLPDERVRRQLAAWQALVSGVPGFFTPRWAPGRLELQAPPCWTSLYDPTPVKALLEKYVDFSALGASPVRLLVSAVNVETAALEVFDSYVDILTPEHILASGSLPPAFPWTTIGDRHYWDGGIVSNSPLELLLARSGAAGKRIFVVDLFPNNKPLPANLMEVMGRRDEIVYAERIRRDSTEQAMLSDLRKLVSGVLAQVPAQAAARIRAWPAYVQLMGEDTTLDITRLTREVLDGESASKDYDFSRTSIKLHIDAGYEMASRRLGTAPHLSCYHPVPGASGG